MNTPAWWESNPLFVTAVNSQTHNLLLWISGGRRRHRFLHSSPQRLAWRRSSSPWLWRCPPWPGPGKSLEEPHGRRTRSGCCRLAPGQWRHNWSVESETKGSVVMKGLSQVENMNSPWLLVQYVIAKVKRKTQWTTWEDNAPLMNRQNLLKGGLPH